MYYTKNTWVYFILKKDFWTGWCICHDFKLVQEKTQSYHVCYSDMECDRHKLLFYLTIDLEN